MREGGLLSPHRARPRPAETRDRPIATDAPNVMWAIDGTPIATVRDGKTWLFATAEQWNAEALGWHVAKRGTRREALRAMGMAVRGAVRPTSAATPPAACSSATITAAASWPRTSRPR